MNYSINRYKKCLNNFSTSYFKKAKDIALELSKKYEHIKKSHFPIIYVAKIQPEWFENHEIEFNFTLSKNLEIRAKSIIPSSSIIARVDFPNGLEHMTVYSNGPQPTPWEKQEWHNICKSMNLNDFKINSN